MKPAYQERSRRPRESLRAVALLLGLGCGKDPLDEHVRPLAENVGAGPASPTNPDSYAPSSGGGPGQGATGSQSGGAAAGAQGLAGSGTGASSGQAGAPVTPEPQGPFSKRGLREALAACAIGSYEEFEAAARELANSTAALAADPGSSTMAARSAWLTAMASWQRAELLRFGPAAKSGDPGGQNLRDEIYNFPLANYCRIDQQIVDQSYASGSFQTTLSSARGLSAIEYLLFHTGPGNACSSVLDINANGSWAALSTAELAQRRFAYAARASQDVRERATQLVNAWQPASGNFAAQFVDPARGGSPYGSEQRAFNAVSDALLYLEKEVKDWKLGWPLGLVPECLNAPGLCPADVESRYARVSTDHLRQNLAGFRRVFQGCGANGAGFGFDDWLTAVGADDLSERMLSALDAAQAAAQSMSTPIETALLENPEPVRRLHASVKAVTDLLKTEFITVLDFELPMALEGDND